MGFDIIVLENGVGEILECEWGEGVRMVEVEVRGSDRGVVIVKNGFIGEEGKVERGVGGRDGEGELGDVIKWGGEEGELGVDVGIGVFGMVVFWGGWVVCEVGVLVVG